MKKITFWILLIFLITIITFGNALWYFYSHGYIFRSQQSYRMREFLSSIYKVIVYLLPALVLFWQHRHQSRRVYWDKIRGPLTLLFVSLLIIAKIIAVDFITIDTSKIVLFTFCYVLVINSAIEEYVFRGILLSKFSKKHSFRAANILQACCFGLIHLPVYMRMGRTGGSLIGALLGVALLGLRRGYVKKQTNGLFYPALLHSIWNGVLLFL